MKKRLKLPSPVHLRSGEHPIYSRDTIDAYLPIADIVRSDEALWRSIELINAEYKKYPVFEGRDMTKIYPEYAEVMKNERAISKRAAQLLEKHNLVIDDLTWIFLWSFIHNHLLSDNGF